MRKRECSVALRLADSRAQRAYAWRGAGRDARPALVAASMRRAGLRLSGAPHRASLMVCEGARLFGIGAPIAVDVVVGVARHRSAAQRFGRYRGESGHWVDTVNASLVTHSDRYCAATECPLSGVADKNEPDD
jgi:hypothetical protein